MRSKFQSTRSLILVALAAFMLGSVSVAFAATAISGKNIKKGTIPYSALSKDAKKQLAKSSKAGPQGAPGAQGPAGASAARYWAYVTEAGAVGRSSGGVTASYVTNGATNKQYQVRFPADITQCGYSVTTGDTDPITAAGAVDGYVPAITRSAADANTVAVHLWLRNTANASFLASNMGQSSFYIAVFC